MTEPGGPTGSAAVAPEDAGSSATGRGGVDPARLWVSTIQALADRAAHEIRGALNGVMVNLEVVRTRAARSGTGAQAAPFLANAAEQLELLIQRTDALLAMTRAAPRPLDVGAVLARLAGLLGPAARTRGGAIELVDDAGGAPTATTADPEVARLVLAAVLVAAADTGRRTLCRIAARDAIIVRVEEAERTLHIAPDVVRAAADAGIGIELAPDATIVAFPAVPR